MQLTILAVYLAKPSFLLPLDKLVGNVYFDQTASTTDIYGGDAAQTINIRIPKGRAFTIKYTNGKVSVNEIN